MIKVIQNNTIILKCTQGTKYVGSCRIFGLQLSIDKEKKHGNDLTLGYGVGAIVMNKIPSYPITLNPKPPVPST